MSGSICDGVDDANSTADSDNFMYENLTVKLTVIGRSVEKQYELHAIGLNVWDGINNHDQTYTQHELFSARLCI